MGSVTWGEVRRLAYSGDSENDQNEEGCLAGALKPQAQPSGEYLCVAEARFWGIQDTAE